jgi:fructose-bisphosphate aldolase, class II
LLDGELARKSAYDPRAWGRLGETAIARRIAEASELYGAAGRSLLSSA